MGLRRSRRSKRPNTADLAVNAYVAWRHECVAVWDAYLTWKHAHAVYEPQAFGAYEAALEREEMAASAYAELTRRVGYVAELGLARQLTYPVITSGAQS